MANSEMNEDVSSVGRLKLLRSKIKFDENYKINPVFVPATCVEEAHTTLEMAHFAKQNENVDIEAKVYVREKGKRELTPRTMGKAEFLRHLENGLKLGDEHMASLREWGDPWASDQSCWAGGNGGLLLGQDYIPLLSGPFYKQLYYYDYLRMHALAFHAYHHDPAGQRAIDMMVQFTLGRGYKVVCEDPRASALWDAFSKVNDLDRRFDFIAREYLMFGEQFIWWLPGNEVNIAYNVAPGQQPNKGLIPRIRQIDPSVIWEIVTYPEDIERILYYQWVAPTQYQLYTGMDKGSPVPGMKFIWQQIPADQVQHFKMNCVSNEKRGRSILFSSLGDLKRLGDTINFSIASLQKNAAWSIDTSIEGNQDDIDSYVRAQEELGTIPSAGSEFVHTSKITRQYLANQNASGGGRGGGNSAFDWALSRIAMGTGIPVSYFGTHISGAGTRASAIVATEPVAKLFEYIQNQYEYILRNIAENLFQRFGISMAKAKMEVTFPEIIVQDRSAKMKDIALAETSKWISKERAANMSAKELGVTEFKYDDEKKKIEKDGVEAMANSPFGPNGAPLTTPGKTENLNQDSSSAVTSDEKKDLNNSRGF